MVFIWLNFNSPMPVVNLAQSLAISRLARFRVGCPENRRLEVGRRQIRLLAVGTVLNSSLCWVEKGAAAVEQR